MILFWIILGLLSLSESQKSFLPNLPAVSLSFYSYEIHTFFFWNRESSGYYFSLIILLPVYLLIANYKHTYITSLHVAVQYTLLILYKEKLRPHYKLIFSIQYTYTIIIVSVSHL
jgi:hypothetical protein